MKKIFLSQKYTYSLFLIISVTLLFGCFNKQKLHMKANYNDYCSNKDIIDDKHHDNELCKARTSLLITLLSNKDCNVNIVQDAWRQGTILHHIINVQDWNLLTKVLEIENVTQIFNFKKQDVDGNTCRELLLRTYNGPFNMVNALLTRLQFLEKADLIDNLIFCLKNETHYPFKFFVNFTLRKVNNFFKNEDCKHLITLLKICKNDQMISKVYDALHLQPNDRIANMPLLIWAIRENNLSLFNFLINNDTTNLNVRDDWSRHTALIEALFVGNFNLIERLVAKDVDLDMQGNHGQTALMVAAYIGYFDIVQLLVKNHADINMQDTDGRTALMAAADRGYSDIVKLLVKKGADVNMQDTKGMTALMFAAKHGNTNVATLLIENHADVNIQDIDNRIALVYAAMYNHLDIVNLLLDNGSDVNIQDIYGFKALRYVEVIKDVNSIKNVNKCILS